MERISTTFSSVLILLILSSAASAQCTVNGKEVPCDQFWDQFGLLFAGLGVFWLVIMVILLFVFLVGFVFWIWMLVDCIKRDFKDRALWILILLLTGFLGAIIYFLLIKRKK